MYVVRTGDVPANKQQSSASLPPAVTSPLTLLDRCETPVVLCTNISVILLMNNSLELIYDKMLSIVNMSESEYILDSKYSPQVRKIWKYLITK